MEFKLHPYHRLDKAIHVEGPVYFEIDNDDVGPGNTLLAEHLVAILNEHWKPLAAYRCEYEGCDDYLTYLRDSEVRWMSEDEADGRPWDRDIPNCPTCGNQLDWAEVYA